LPSGGVSERIILVRGREKGTRSRGLLITLALLTLTLVLAAGLPASAQGTITGFDPTHGSVGTVVVISGTEFTGSTDVRIGGASVGAGNFTVDSDGEITATVPSDAATGNIEIDTPGGVASSADPFRVDTEPPPSPTIDSFTPRGPEGAPIVITGSGLSTTSDVEFGNKSAQFSVIADDHLTAYVPVGAPTAPITVTTDGGTVTTADPFVVQPNVVIIVSDDQRYDELAHMPTVESELVDKGTTFRNGFISNPLCCPSRTSILTGQYSGTNGVWSNEGPYGGFPSFHGDGSTVATWLNSSGYDTGLVGKYLNLYGPGGSYIPPGWDRWVAFNEMNGLYYDYHLQVDNSTVTYGGSPADYSTDVLARYADHFIRDAPDNRPLFLYFTPYAPHAPSTPPPRYDGLFSNEPGLRLPSFNEQDVSDKPAYIRDRRSMTSSQIAASDANYRHVLESLRGLDDAVGTIMSALADTGRLRNTLIFYLSDNGIEQGEHRWGFKAVPYEESIHVPYLVRWDRLSNTPRTESKMAANIDLAPTIADAAHVPAPGVDGRSLLPLLDGSGTVRRSTILIEGLALERPGGASVPSFCGVRTSSRVFVHYATGEDEYYALRTDPYELKNKASLPKTQATVTKLRNQTRTLCDPLPPGMPAF
jgi:arylsulfatase A-like enzyme